MAEDEQLPPPPEPGDPAYITQADVIRLGKAGWRKVAPTGYKDILDSPVVE